MTLDGLLTLMDWSNPAFTSKLQIADAVLTAIYTLVQITRWRWSALRCANAWTRRAGLI
jgi:hypothetical protein